MDDIWDAPIAQDTPKRPASGSSRAGGDNSMQDAVETPQRPTKRARQALFLADSDDDEGFNPSPAGPSSKKQKSTSNGRRIPANKPPPATDLNIEELFAGIDDDDDVQMSRPLPALVTEEKLTREAEAKYKRLNKQKEMELRQIMSSPPPRETDDVETGKKGKGKDKNGDERQARRRQLKLDENLLLGPRGFPELVQMTKDFKIKGKGHEATDLDRLLRVYQYWTHQLYPKTIFADTVERVEKLCHTRRMNVAMSVWRDEFHGKPRHLEESDEDDENENQDPAPAADQDTNRSSTKATQDLPRSSPPRSSSRGSSPPHDVGADDEEFWKSLDMGMVDATATDEGLSDGPPPPPASSGAPSDMDEDDDIWDVINQIQQDQENSQEKEASSHGENQPMAGSAPAPSGPGVAAGPLLQNQPPDDDWDDMYA